MGRAQSDALLLAFFRAASAQVAQETEPIVGLPCEGCEGVFECLPDRLTSVDGLVKPDRDANGVWTVVRDIRLGEAVPGYAAVRRAPPR